MLLEKRFSCREAQGLRGLEIRALSGAGMEDLVALETWPSGGEIANLK